MKMPNIPLISYLVHLIEEVLKTEAPIVGKAAEAAAIETAEQDPKVQAITAGLVVLAQANQTLKTAVNEHPDAPEIVPASNK